jgi:hypothetical protein
MCSTFAAAGTSSQPADCAQLPECDGVAHQSLLDRAKALARLQSLKERLSYLALPHSLAESRVLPSACDWPRFVSWGPSGRVGVTSKHSFHLPHQVHAQALRPCLRALSRYRACVRRPGRTDPATSAHQRLRCSWRCERL